MMIPSVPHLDGTGPWPVYALRLRRSGGWRLMGGGHDPARHQVPIIAMNPKLNRPVTSKMMSQVLSFSPPGLMTAPTQDSRHIRTALTTSTRTGGQPFSGLPVRTIMPIAEASVSHSAIVTTIDVR